MAGIAAFKADQTADAERFLGTALQAWDAAAVFDSTLIDNAQQYAAALALRRGDTAQSTALMRQYLRNAGGLDRTWGLPADKSAAWLEHRETGMGLPLQAAGFSLQEPDDARRIFYRDLKTEFQLGLSSGMAIPASEAEQEALLRKALLRQFKLEPGALHKQRFVATQSAAGQTPRVGQRWVFEVRPVVDAADATDSRAPRTAVRQVMLWIVDQGEQRAILRASITTPAQARQAQQLAQALRW